MHAVLACLPASVCGVERGTKKEGTNSSANLTVNLNRREQTGEKTQLLPDELQRFGGRRVLRLPVTVSPTDVWHGFIMQQSGFQRNSDLGLRTARGGWEDK